MDTATPPTPGETTATPEPAAPQPPPPPFSERVKGFRARHSVAEAALFFLGGFLFEVVMLDRIDSPLGLAQQVAYLVLLAVLLLYALKDELGKAEPAPWVRKAWRFSEDVIHFLLGTMLSKFSLFYFQSAAGPGPLLFLGFIFLLLIANDVPRFRKLGHVARIGLFAFCLTSFLSYALPIAFGFLSKWLFLLAVALSVGITFLLFLVVRRWSGPGWAWRRWVLPMGAVQGALLLLYFAHAIPPIPLSIQQMGVYHEVEKDGPHYRLLHQKPYWKWWQSGDQTFYARPGDRVFIFARIFAPSRFQDRIGFRWAYQDPKKGWQVERDYRVAITGGREHGYRGHDFRVNARPGQHRAEVVTDDDRVIGSIRFEVIEDDSTDPRAFVVDQS